MDCCALLNSLEVYVPENTAVLICGCQHQYIPDPILDIVLVSGRVPGAEDDIFILFHKAAFDNAVLLCVLTRAPGKNYS